MGYPCSVDRGLRETIGMPQWDAPSRVLLAIAPLSTEEYGSSDSKCEANQSTRHVQARK